MIQVRYEYSSARRSDREERTFCTTKHIKHTAEKTWALKQKKTFFFGAGV